MNPMETRLKADECADFYRSCIAAVSDDARDRRRHAQRFRVLRSEHGLDRCRSYAASFWGSEGAVFGIRERHLNIVEGRKVF